MPRFLKKTTKKVDHHTGKELTKEEFDAKRQAAIDAKTIISWKSASRVFKARTKRYFVKVAFYILFSASDV